MATAAPPEPDDRECSICHEPYTQPKLIPCGHLACRHCLISWLQSQQDATCPLCRDVIVDPERRAGSSLERIVDDFPTDLSMVAKVEADRLLNRNQNCCVCEDVAAISLCLDCRDMLCSSCVKVHGKLSSLRHHKVKSLVSLTAEELVANPAPSPCANHPDKSCELYCTTHNVSICHVCATSRHRGCPEVLDLEEKAGEAHRELAELTDRLSTGEAQLDQAITNLDHHLLDAEKAKQMAMAEIKEMCDRLDSAVRGCRNRLKDLELSSYSDVTTAAQEGKNCLLQRRGRLTSHKGVVQSCQGMKMRESIIEMSQKMKTRVDYLDFSTTFPVEAKAFSTVTLMIDPEIVSRVEAALENIAQVKVVPAQLSSPSQNLPQPTSFSFHARHGKNIVLSNNQQTAEKKEEDELGGLVFSSCPMMRRRLYEVQLDDREAKAGFTILVGVITSPPSTLTSLPDDAFGLKHAVIVWNSGVRKYGTPINTNVGQKLKNLRQGSRIGLMINNSHSLHLYIDGEDQGLAADFVFVPCFLFLDMQYVYKKITTLPVTVL